MSTRWFLGLGSNQGDSQALLRSALHRIAGFPGTRVVAVSSLYLTEPVGPIGQPWFYNLVAEVLTELPPSELLRLALATERELGRERGERYGPRTIDIDLLWYDGPGIETPALKVPHPRLEERRFVLEPLAELAADLCVQSGRTVREALARVAGQRVKKLGTEEKRP